MRIFDAHFHIIDFNFPIIENQGYLPPSYVVEDYQNETANLNVLGGAIVSEKAADKILYTNALKWYFK